MARSRLLQAAAAVWRLDAAEETLFELGGFSEPTKEELKRRRKDAEAELEHWAEQFARFKEGP